MDCNAVRRLEAARRKGTVAFLLFLLYTTGT